jgi:gliding motility-associated-like protein
VNGKQLLILLLYFVLICEPQAFSQYVLNGSAQTTSCNCYTLTTPTTTQSGSVWNATKINLNNPFDFWFNVFLGCSNTGADGIVFMLQPLSTSVGTTGEGLGFGGVSPSIGISLDTYQNTNLSDPAFDHISIQKNGIVNHNNDLAGPVPISSLSDNVEDCQWHRLRISWDPLTQWLRTYFDGVLRREVQVDLIGSIFNNDPLVYWGFSGATGGEVNLQQFCTALNPVINTGLAANSACANYPVQFSSQSESFAPITAYHWNFGDGTTSSQEQPPLHQYAQPGTYTVMLRIRGLDGCEKDSSKVITIGERPEASLQVFDTCYSRTPRLNYSAAGAGNVYAWLLNGVPVAQNAPPPLDQAGPGPVSLEYIVMSQFPCDKADTAQVVYQVKPIPKIDMDSSQQCTLLAFSGWQLDNATSINQWQWNFGDGNISAVQNPMHQYIQPGNYQLRVWAKADNGCISDTLYSQVVIPSALAFAGNDTTVITGESFQLNGSGNGNPLWSPSAGLSDPFVYNPQTTIIDAQEFFLTVTTAEGCVGKDTVLVRSFAGPAIYVPSGFTPNGDGLNDLLKPVYVGIKKLDHFSVFNRWGQQVFTTMDMRKGWDGTIRQLPSPTGSFVWIIKGINNLDQPFIKKGTTTIIR